MSEGTVPHIFSKIVLHPDENLLLLATIIAARGSTPQVVGAHALFNGKGLLAGTLGGGTVEADAARKARDCLEKRRSDLVEYNLSADIQDSHKPACGGWVRILFQPLNASTRAVFSEAVETLENRGSGILHTTIRSPLHSPHVERRWISFSVEAPEQMQDVLKGGSPTLREENPDVWIFLEPLFPRPTLVIAGAGHIGGAVAHLGRLLDFEVILLDDRPELAHSVPDAHTVTVGDIAESLRKIAIAEDTYIVIVTRGHKDDAEALRACIGRESAYIGMIGSRRKVQLMRDEFLSRGWATKEQLDRLFSPIGLDINSTTVQEIAVSIAAQLVKIRADKQHTKHTKHTQEERWFGP